jgi:hypothetical protein
LAARQISVRNVQRDAQNPRQLAQRKPRRLFKGKGQIVVKECLLRGFCVLVLTNAMKPMRRWSGPLIDLKERMAID